MTEYVRGENSFSGETKEVTIPLNFNGIMTGEKQQKQ